MGVIVHFDLVIEGSPPTWSIRCTTSDGSGSTSTQVAWDVSSWATRSETIHDWITGVYSSVLEPDDAASSNVTLREKSRLVGRKLYEIIFVDEIRSIFRNKWREIEEGKIQELQVRLDLREDRLWLIPWEILFDPDIGFLATFPRISVARYVSTGQTYASLTDIDSLRLCAITAQPNQYPLIGYDQRKASAGFSAIKRGHHVEIIRISGEKTLEKLKKNKPFHILDVTCHGGFSEEEFVCVFEGPKRAPQRITISELLKRLFEWKLNKHIRLVFFKSCFSDAGGNENLLGSVGVAFTRTLNIPAVIGMQFLIRTDIALDLSQAFYEHLSDNGSITQALREARQSIESKHLSSMDWAIPTLTLRCSDTQLFQRASVAGSSSAVMRSDPVLTIDKRIEELNKKQESATMDIQRRLLSDQIRFLEKKKMIEEKIKSSMTKRKSLASELLDRASELLSHLRNDMNEGRTNDQFFDERRADAIRYLDLALEIKKTAKCYLIRSEIDAEIDQNFESALQCCRNAIEVAPDYPEPCYRFIEYARKIEQEFSLSQERRQQLRREIAEVINKLKQMGGPIDEGLEREYLSHR